MLARNFLYSYGHEIRCLGDYCSRIRTRGWGRMRWRDAGWAYRSNTSNGVEKDPALLGSYCSPNHWNLKHSVSIRSQLDNGLQREPETWKLQFFISYFSANPTHALSVIAVKFITILIIEVALFFLIKGTINAMEYDRTSPGSTPIDWSRGSTQKGIDNPVVTTTTITVQTAWNYPHPCQTPCNKASSTRNEKYKKQKDDKIYYCSPCLARFCPSFGSSSQGHASLSLRLSSRLTYPSNHFGRLEIFWPYKKYD